MRLGVLGCAGRMGRACLIEILDGGGLLGGGLVRPADPAAGRDLGELVGRPPAGVVAAADAGAVIDASDALIEFSAPEPSLTHAEACAARGKAHVLGTTGFNEGDVDRLRRAAARIPIVWAPNMSVAVALLGELVARAAGALGDAFDAEILEMHHARKVDAPSGTALALGSAIAEARGTDLEAASVRRRDGRIGPRPPGAIGFACLRGGDVVGDHRVVFAGPGERLEIAHLASDRRIYARGAVRAAGWAVGRPPGLYGMRDVLA